ncbi:PAS domain-containing protein [Paenibacillus sp. NPDC057967]|uniref:PAS domain-containing sensor histidine kinase n=1 Tax=Paenibacillus sp. NPDC057967 TaxID=3346293 RepID=UPI0036DF3FD9
MNNDPRNLRQTRIDSDVSSLLTSLSEQLGSEELLARARLSLTQLADIQFALDESSIVAITDAKGVIRYVNDKFCEISKYEREELIGQDHRIINSGYHDKDYFRNLWKTISSGSVWRGEIKNKAKDGSYYWVNTTIVPFLGDEGKPYQFLAIRSEVTALKEAQRELKHLMEKIMLIQEEERKRISRELHDGVGQSLFSLLISLDRIIGGQEGQDDLEKLRGDVSALMEDVRGLAWELRPSVLDDLGVKPAIRTFTENYMQHFGIKVQLDIRLTSRLGTLKETVIYRIIQEALTNVAKYAGVESAEVLVEERDDDIVVCIRDEGAGFVRNASESGVGLFSMEERAGSVNGRLSIQSEPGKGTTVRLIVPKP